MRIAVIGAGAVGCYFGSRLVKAGADVIFMARSYQAEMLAREGLIYQSGDKREHIPVRATAHLEDIAHADIFLLCVKTYHTLDAARQLASRLRPEAVVVCMQNGASNAAAFSEAAGHPALPAVVYVGAQMEGPTHLHHKGAGHIILGTPRGYAHPAAPPLETTAAELNRGFPCKISNFIERELWQKLIINSAYNGISAITQKPYGPMIGNAEIVALMQQVVREGIAVAATLDIPFVFEEMWAAVLEIGRMIPGQYSSTAQDLQRGKRTEIDALNGEIVRLGRQQGIPVTANHAVCALVQLMESR